MVIAGSNCCVADPHERALLVDQLGVETDRCEVFDDVCDGERLEHDLVTPGRQLDRLRPRQRLRRSASSENLTVECSQAEGGVAGGAVGAVVPGDARQTALGRFAGQRLARRVGETARPVVGAAVARRLEAAGGVDEGPHDPGPVGRRRLGGGLIDRRSRRPVRPAG